ncbi:probable serine/threonine-protein kinase qkgA [Ptychodera flava]|uniref:probable serine/threonine-protein kinase qkgA n=1 Tax=Ptychodera flava TaxID=63121 RepID=UPI00396A7637
MMEDAVISGLKCQTEERHLKTANRSTRSRKENISLAEDLKEEGEDISKLADRLKERVKFAGDTSVPDLDFSLWDFAGQFVYYITHQVFLTSKVVYMLVTDLTKSLEESTKIMLSESSVQEQVLPNEWKVKDFLSFWMNLIHTQGAAEVTVNKEGRKVVKREHFSPPVIIVGTKKDLLDDPENDSKKRLKEIKEYLGRTVPVASRHIVGMIALDNKSRKDEAASDPEVKRLREMIKHTAMEHFNIGNIPVKWLQLELALKKRKEETMPLCDAYRIGKDINLTDDGVTKALAFFHSVGEILHFDMMSETRNLVILNVGWLVGLFKILITQSIACKDDIDAPPMLSYMTDELYLRGRLHEDLVDHVLKCNRRSSDKAVLLATMKQFDILCEKPTEVNRGNRHVYYLPWLHQSACDTGEDIIHPPGSTPSCSLYFHFRGNFLPDGLFYRLIVRCLRKWPRATELVKHRIRILVDSAKDLHLVIRKEALI